MAFDPIAHVEAASCAPTQYRFGRRQIREAPTPPISARDRRSAAGPSDQHETTVEV